MPARSCCKFPDWQQRGSDVKILVPFLTNSAPIKAGDALFFYRKADANKTKHNPQPIAIGQLTKALGKETARKDKF